MKTIYILSVSILTLIVMTSFSNCASSNELQQEPPMEVGEAYFQRWTAGVKGGGAGINLFIPIKSELQDGIELDSVYFRKMAAKIEKSGKNSMLYVAHIKSNQNNQQDDIILSTDPREEAKNKLPVLPVKMPFEVADNECIVSCIVNGKKQYFILKGIKEKDGINYPMAREN